ncbi:hypothetical protein BJY01DRAFT_248066 [Aspergillus pseudoustus]|uniref:BZIP domain-containing protein n=1 Tax=Aspergillus pseudoustus TaxID=1810923 RepID=A0ABR4JWY6_9EURO
MAEQRASWTEHGASFPPFSSPYTSPTDVGDFPLHLIYGLDTNGEYETRRIPPLSLQTTGLGSSTGMHKHSSLSPTTSDTSLSATDTSSPTLLEGRGPAFPASNPSPEARPKSGPKNTKRTIQNRAAQRRFRERRDEQARSLRERVENLQEKYEALGEKLNERSDEVDRLEKVNEELRSEAQDLRRRWQTMLLLLQRPKSQQFLSLFSGPAGLPADDLDVYVRCLDALIFIDDARS